MNAESGENSSDALSVHERLAELCTYFHQIQDELLQKAGAEQGAGLRKIATTLVELSLGHMDQVLGELFLGAHSNYNFSKPLYVGASLVELIRRYNDYDTDSAIDDDKREQLILAALGYNLGLLAYEKQFFESQQQISPQERQKLREHYPQQSADMMKAAGLDQPVIQDVIRNHNVISENPSPHTLMMRTPFVYAGIAMPQNLVGAQLSIVNPSREFVCMFIDRKLDPTFGGLYLKINGLAPIGSILKLESREKAVVVKGPEDEDISSSTVRMLTNRDGVQLLRPGGHYPLNKTPSQHRGLADHHNFAWSNFSPHEMWEK